MTQANTPAQDVQDMVAQSDTGARTRKGWQVVFFGSFLFVGHCSNFGMPPHYRLFSILVY